MSEYQGCDRCKHKNVDSKCYPCNECKKAVVTYNHYEPFTNADRIRNMTDEELAELLREAEDCGYRDASITPIIKGQGYMDMLEWLQAEVKEGDSNENT